MGTLTHRDHRDLGGYICNRIIGRTIVNWIERPAVVALPNPGVVAPADDLNAEFPLKNRFTNAEVCGAALDSEKSDWEQSSQYSSYVAEAIRRGLTVANCRQTLGLSSCSFAGSGAAHRAKVFGADGNERRGVRAGIGRRQI